MGARPSIIDGSHPQVRSGDEFAEGRLRLVLDIGWHETQHQFQFEVLGKPEQSYRGHGPVFRELCNRVGEKIGLPPVRTAKARGKDRFLPSCAEWPICVRPPGYYLGAFLFEREDVAHEADAEGAGLRPPKALADWLAEHPQWAQRFATVGDGIFVLLDRFFDENPAPATIEKQAVMFLAKAYRHRRRTRPKQTVAAQPALPAPTPVQLT